jgi:hypothetical protein
MVPEFSIKIPPLFGEYIPNAELALDPPVTFPTTIAVPKGRFNPTQLRLLPPVILPLIITVTLEAIATPAPL